MELTKFVSTLDWNSLGEHTQKITKLCVMDLIGCALIGTQDKAFSEMVAASKAIDGEGDNPIWGSDHTMGLGSSIFMNSYTASLYDMDDGHRKAQGHPGAAIIPVVLNLAYEMGASGKALLEAVVVGYEVAVRSALVMRQLGGPRKGSGAWVTPGVAAAVAKLKGFNESQTAHAIGLAEYYAPQATQDRSVKFPSQMKEGLPWGAYTGYRAAILAEHGFTAMRPHLADSEFIEDLGKSFEIERTYFKKYACCRWAHPAIDGLAELRQFRPLPLDEIEHITIRTFEKALPLNKTKPTNTLEAVYSIPFSVAAFLFHGQVDPEEVTGENLEHPAVLDLAKRVTLELDQDFTNEFPYKCLEQVTVRFKDGSQWQSDVLSARGDPDNPYTDEEMMIKFRSLSEWVLGDKWEQIPKLIGHLAEKSAADLVDLLQP